MDWDKILWRGPGLKHLSQNSSSSQDGKMIKAINTYTVAAIRVVVVVVEVVVVEVVVVVVVVVVVDGVPSTAWVNKRI